jgi:hypothetical protein
VDKKPFRAKFVRTKKKKLHFILKKRELPLEAGFLLFMAVEAASAT